MVTWLMLTPMKRSIYLFRLETGSMITDKNETLFSKGTLVLTLDTQLAKVAEKVDEIPKDQFLATNEEDLFDYIYSLLFVHSIELHDEEVELEEEIKIKLRNCAYRNHFGKRRPILVPGIRVTITTPFTGNGELWN